MRIAIVMGGPSAEYDVSIMTGVEMARHILGQYALLRVVVIDRDTRFFYRDLSDSAPGVEECAAPGASRGFCGPYAPAAAEAVWHDIDVALLALHGEFGEDGRFQGYLDTLGIAYTGSGVMASSVGMDKIVTKRLLLQQGIATPPFSLYGEAYPEHTPEALARRHGFPCYAKCPQSGSSQLMGRAESVGELDELLRALRQHSETILVESAVEGPELSCPVLEYPDGSCRVLPVVEIRPLNAKFFDYTAKYTEGACDDIIPAPQPAAILEQAGATALALHRLLGCSGVSRTDSIVSGETLQVLEINTLPGFTPLSLVPRCFASTGGSYAELLDIIIQTALARQSRQRR